MKRPAGKNARAASDQGSTETEELAAAARLETFLARIYVDAAARARFLEDPMAVARNAGLAADDVQALAAVDRGALEAAADSFAHKRANKTDTER